MKLEAFEYPVQPHHPGYADSWNHEWVALTVDEPVDDELPSETPPLAPCLRCAVTYRLVGIEETDTPRHDLYTFECPCCGHLETRTVRVR
jgi:hypothetical protein